MTGDTYSVPAQLVEDDLHFTADDSGVEGFAGGGFAVVKPVQAAAEVLKGSGVPALTMDEVARRAGTNKNALYRRWPNRVALGVAAYRRLAATETVLPDTGSLRGDTLEMLRRANSTWSSPYGEILRGLIAAAGSTPELLAELRDPAAESAREAAWLTLLGRAVARGDAAPEALHPRVAYAPVALLRNEYVMLAFQGPRQS
ncbi:TetR/AcrR family transcriptional regulator [Streptomyces sp. NPDC060022]|uniref:TetR/AcrR family transcriptional regulator n=1 Tax=Streptomyces sp. NPDC060022 TaxID=3347039 RepID=UPI0036CD3F25